MKIVKVLFLAADPFRQSPLGLPEEARRIAASIRGSRERCIDFETAWAVRVGDLQTELLNHRPDIVHFSGHGTETKELTLESDTGEPFQVGSRGLSSLLAQFKSHVHLVVLNACFSASHAQEIVQEIDFCVGMNAAIGDEAATCFAEAFYQALASGTSIRTAFELGKTAMILQNIPEEEKPQLFSRPALGERADAILTQSQSESVVSALEPTTPGHSARWWQSPATIAAIGAAGAIIAAVIGIVPSLLRSEPPKTGGSTPTSVPLRAETATNKPRPLPTDFPASFYTFPASARARSVVERITQAIGLPQDFVVEAGNAQNAYAWLRDGKKVLVYNEQFLDKIASESGTAWATAAMFAHEIGHHVKGHVSGRKLDHEKQEIEADIFAGQVLFRMGAPVESTRSVFSFLPTNGAGYSGSASARAAGLESGWRSASDAESAHSVPK